MLNVYAVVRSATCLLCVIKDGYAALACRLNEAQHFVVLSKRTGLSSLVWGCFADA